MRAELETNMERSEAMMITGCVVSLNERRPSTDTRRCLVVETIVDVMRRCSLRCQGHTESTKL